MRIIGGVLGLSPTDLAQFLGCRHRTALEMAAAYGGPPRPVRDDPLLELLFQRGLEHERTYVDSLRLEGRQVVDLADIKDPDAAVAATLDAMRARADVIVQAALRDGRWYGRPDVLRRVDTPGALGDWSYEAEDTKLSRETRAGTILQLGIYSAMLREAQGIRPELFRVVTPDPERPVHEFRTDDYAAYVRWIRQRMEEAAARDPEVMARAHYPEPVDHCDICPWYPVCNDKRHRDDHLSLVAGISALQRRELEDRGIPTLTALGRMPLPIPFRPRRGAVGTYVRVREQARLQLDSRERTPPLHELRTLEDGKGLARLPDPSPGDVFLDLEGDPFAREGGREYLFGVVTLDETGAPAYRSWWAFDDPSERRAFEEVMDLLGALWKAHEGMHIYHYAPYETGAFKRLMGRYATRGEELDRMLRSGRFVDLYGVVRQGVLAGVERYSIKSLEPLYGFTRTVPLPQANRALRVMEQALELGAPADVPGKVRTTVEGYNRDDCTSAFHLRGWLEGLRADLVASGVAVPRPIAADDKPSENVDERTQRAAALRARLLEGIPEDRAQRDDEQQARWLLAYLLDWHRREDKAAWWEYFRLRELPEEDLLDEPEAVAGLEYLERVEIVTNARTGKPTGSVVGRYRFPPQEMEIRRQDELKRQDGKKWGEVVDVDRIALTIDVKKGGTQADVHPAAVFAHKYIDTDVLEDALDSVGRTVAERGLVSAEGTGPYAAAERLLLREPPRLGEGAFAQGAEESALDFAERTVRSLDRSVLAIQGPPGSGKTFTGGAMIAALIAQGKKVGVTATGHKVIRKLLQSAGQAAGRTGVEARLAHKGDDGSDGAPIGLVKDNGEALAAIRDGGANVLGGTPWLWARPEFAGTVDVLFVDEAGQISLANVLAMAGAASSIVLLGDPQQLDQPRKGSHPEGVNVSALTHVLAGRQTIGPEQGIFLPVTWRLAPRVCAFTSEVFYEGKLGSKPGLENQRLTGAAGLEGSGLRLVEISHEGNRSSSLEEIEAIVSLVGRLSAEGSRWIDENGVERPVRPADILVVAPYNAQVSRLAERLEPAGVNVGTVDKFQGQEAPVVIYSMTTSRPEDAPRGMEFLYSPNRLNVATSRAQCVAILVASPRLFEPDCKTPRQIKLANGLCRYRELSE